MRTLAALDMDGFKSASLLRAQESLLAPPQRDHNALLFERLQANSHFAVTVHVFVLRRDDVERKLRLRESDGGATQGFFSSAWADADALSAVALAPGLLLPSKSPHLNSLD